VESATIRQEVMRLNQELDTAYAIQNELASLCSQMDALALERTHFDLFAMETEPEGGVVPEDKRLLRLSSGKVAALLVRFLSEEPHMEGPIREQIRVWERVRLAFRFGPSVFRLYRYTPEKRITLLQRLFYRRRTQELTARKDEMESALAGVHFDEKLARLQFLSLQLLKDFLGARYNGKPRHLFALEDLWKDPKRFLEQYPVVLSTTFSVLTSVKNGHVFDYVIVDEASPVDLLNGVLALGCAKKIVIVGDRMQLPNVVTTQM